MSLILAALCTAAKANDPAKREGYIEQFLCNSGKFGLRLPPDVRALFQLGPILQQANGEVEQEEGYTATRTYVMFSGLELGFIVFSNDPSRYMISYAEVTSPNWQIAGPFRVGNTAKAAQDALGPVAQNDCDLKRSYGSEAGTVSFEQLAGKITKIRYDCYTG